MFLTIGTFAPAISAAELRCEKIFTSGSQIEGLVERLKEVSKAHKSRTFSSERNDVTRAKLKETLESALAEVRNADDLVLLLKNISKIKKTHYLLEQALSSIDYLAPLRDTSHPWTAENIAKLEKHIESQSASSGSVDWRSLQNGLTLIKDPSKARDLLMDLLQSREGLAGMYLWHESPLHRSFVISITSLPKNIREALFTELVAFRTARHKKFKKGKYKTHSEEVDAKLGVRDVQFLQALLLQPEFTSMLKSLNEIYKKSGTNEEFLSTLESYLFQLRLDKRSYSFKNVIDVAQAMQSTFKPQLSKDGFVEIFGSFPNMNANFKSSDIDIIFSDSLDAAYRQYIKGGMMGSGGFTSAEVEKLSGISKEFAIEIAAMEEQAGNAMGVSRAQGNLFGVSTLPMTLSRGGLFPELSREEFMRFLTAVSSVAVVIRQNEIVIRVYDSVSPPVGAPAIIFDYPLTRR